MNRLLFFFAFTIAMTIVLSGCVVQDNDVTPVPSPSNSSSSETIDLRFSKQFIEGSSTLGEYIQETAGSYSIPEVTVASYNLKNFVFLNLDSPYLLSGYWEKDDFILAGVSESISYLAEPALANVSSLIEDTSASNISEDLTSIFFVPSDVFEVSSLCYDEWDMTACRLQEPTIEKLTYEAGPENSLIISMTVKVYPLYTGESGTPVVEERLYSYVATMFPFNELESLDSEKPMFLINSLDSSLVIGETKELF